MKDLTRTLLSFVLIYGTKDKAKFQRYAMSALENYSIEEHQKTELIEFAYGFFHDLGERINQVDVISRGVRSGVDDLGAKLEAILEKIESVEQEIAKQAVASNRNGHATAEDNK